MLIGRHVKFWQLPRVLVRFSAHRTGWNLDRTPQKVGLAHWEYPARRDRRRA